MAASDSASVSKLATLERQLDLNFVSDTDSEVAKVKYAGKSDSELKGTIERLQSMLHGSRLKDGGDIARKECQLLQAEIKRRGSKSWLHRAEQNRAEGKPAERSAYGQAPSSLRQNDQQGPSRNAQLKDSRNFSYDGASTTLHTRGASTAAATAASSSKSRLGPLPMHATSTMGKRLPQTYLCSQCLTPLPEEDLRWQQTQSGEMGAICQACWKEQKGNKPFPKLDDTQARFIKRAALHQHTAPPRQPAPVKHGEPPMGMEQPSQPQAAKKVTARQSARMQKQQQQKQDEMEPICIDSDDDVHASGSGPAREGNQNGAAVATRHSTRSNRLLSTTQIFKDMRCVYPLGRKLDVVELTEHDLSRLDNNEFLNDTVIDFYAKWIQEHLDSDQQLKFHFFNTFFYKKLTEKSVKKPAPTIIDALGREGTPDSDAGKSLTPAQRNHLRVKSWTKGVDIFSKDFLLIPIHDALHWSLIIVCHPGLDFESSDRKPYILHLDSMEGSCHSLATIGKALRIYLNHEWQRKLEEKDVSSVPAGWAQKHPGQQHKFEAETMPGKSAQVPRQEDYCNCGLFVLAYMDFWTHAPPDQVELCERGAWKGETPYPAFLSKHWFQHQNASALRKHIRNLILQLFREQKRLPDDHQTVINAVSDMAEYQENKDIIKYRSPAEYLEDATAANTKRKEERAKREERERLNKEAKAAEAEKKQAEAKRLAGERAEQREREEKHKQEQASQQEEIEVALSGSEGDGFHPDWLKDKAASVNNAAKRRNSKTAGRSHPDSEVQDLTAESPDEPGRRRLRSGSKVGADAGLPVIAEQLGVRRSKRKTRQTLESSDDDGGTDGQPASKRHLDLQANGKGRDRSLSLDPSSIDGATVPDSEAEVVEPGTQDASEDSQLRDAGQTADMIEQADRCQQPQGSGGSGLEDDLDLQDLSSPPDDQFMEPHQAPSHAVRGDRPASNQWHSALLSEPATAEQAHQLLGCQRAASQQLHHARIAGAQQVHQSHKISLQTLPGRVIPQHDGYQSMNGHGPFNPSKFLQKFNGINLGGKKMEDPPVLADASLSTAAVQDPSAVPGLSDDTDGSQEITLPQSSTSAAHESFGPSSAMSPAPHEPLLTQQHLSVMAPKPAPWESSPLHLPGSCPAGILRGVSQAQSGYLGQHAEDYTETPASDHMHHVLQSTSPVSHPLPSQVLEAAPPSSVSTGSGHASPTAKRRRAAKSLHMMNNTPLAACDVAHSTAHVPGISMMTVPDKPKGRPPIKLSPPKGLLASPVAPVSAQWPAAAGVLHQHAEPPMTSPGRPAAHVEAYAIPGRSQRAEPTGGDARTVTVGQLPNPFQVAGSLASSSGRFREYTRASGLGCAASEDAAELLIQQASDHQMSQGLTDDQFQPPRPGPGVMDLAMTSSQSMQGAEAAGAHYTDQLRQQRLQAHTESQILGESAIDLCGDEAMLEPATDADTRQRKAQICSDERMARELELGMAGKPGMRQHSDSRSRHDSDEDWQPSTSLPRSTTGRGQPNNKRLKASADQHQRQICNSDGILALSS